MAASQPLEPFCYDPEGLAPYDVDIAITHCGVCHSDIALLDNEWGWTVYPFVPGHEIIGTVRAVGPAVTIIAVGQRVGVGWQRSRDRKSTRLNSSHLGISYAVFCLKKKK